MVFEQSGRVALAIAYALAVGPTLAFQISVGVERTPAVAGRQPLTSLSDQEVRTLVEEALNAGLPAHLLDDIYLLSRSRASIIVPALAYRLETVRKTNSLSDKGRPGPREVLLHKIADVVAYSASDEAADVLSRLCSAQPDQFAPNVRRMLDYSESSGNSYALAYRVARNASLVVRRDIAAWARTNAERPGMLDQWALTIRRLEAEKTILAGQQENDVLIGALPDQVAERLMQQLRQKLRGDLF